MYVTLRAALYIECHPESRLPLPQTQLKKLVDALHKRLARACELAKSSHAQYEYSTIEKEALALLWAVNHFEVYLGGSTFPVKVYTDHNPLVFLNRMYNTNQCLMRWSLALQEFNLEIIHKRGVMKVEVEYMLRNGLAEPSQSAWSSPCLLVPKADMSFRFCTDFRKVNAVTKPDCYPLPRIDDCVDRVGPAKFVTKLDLLKGYWQVPLTPRAAEISAFVTPDHFCQ